MGDHHSVVWQSASILIAAFRNTEGVGFSRRGWGETKVRRMRDDLYTSDLYLCLSLPLSPSLWFAKFSYLLLY